MKRESFTGSLAITLALAGSAVGLGNLWRFPYLMGECGGAAFIIIYLALCIIICLPIMMVEFIIGRRSQKNVFGAFTALAPGKKWKYLGICFTLTVVLILSFYSVVGGWSIEYLFNAVTLKFTGEGSSENLSSMFSSFVTNPYKPLITHTVFLLLTSLIVLGGIKKGIERFSKIMMPMLFFLMIGIAVYTMTLPGSAAGLNYIFKPDFSKVTSDTVLKALGQAFFSLSIGCGTVVTYASYANRNENIIKCTAGTALFDSVFAIIAGCAIMPAVFAFGINPSEGPGLAFVTLPYIFSQMSGGTFVAILFFAALVLAALTSSISLLEVVVSLMVEEFKIGRKTAVITSFVIFWILGALCSLSQGVLADFKIFGMTIFDLFDYVSANVLMLAGGLLMTLFVGWSLGRKVIVEELTGNGRYKVPAAAIKILSFLIRYVAPLAVLAIMFL